MAPISKNRKRSETDKSRPRKMRVSHPALSQRKGNRYPRKAEPRRQWSIISEYPERRRSNTQLCEARGPGWCCIVFELSLVRWTQWTLRERRESLSAVTQGGEPRWALRCLRSRTGQRVTQGFVPEGNEGSEARQRQSWSSEQMSPREDRPGP